MKSIWASLESQPSLWKKVLTLTLTLTPTLTLTVTLHQGLQGSVPSGTPD
jgi:hypothetical protein